MTDGTWAHDYVADCVCIRQHQLTVDVLTRVGCVQHLKPHAPSSLQDPPPAAELSDSAWVTARRLMGKLYHALRAKVCALWLWGN